MPTFIRNIAIVAHVDHGKTTLVDGLLSQSGSLNQREAPQSRAMDSNDLEKERGITILSKITSIDWEGHRINIVDTPGHADFGGEVERILSMVDSVLLLVDAVDGPMPQTRFVTQKAFLHGLNPIVVINKIDRPGARPDWVVDQVFDLFDKLGATDEQLDFPIIYASALEGYASLSPDSHEGDMAPLFKAIVENAPSPNVDSEGPFQMQISALDYSNYVGTIGIGRVNRGQIRSNMPVAISQPNAVERKGRVLQIWRYHGLEKDEISEAFAGDIVAVSGISPLQISDTLCDPQAMEPLPLLAVDEPTITMTFQVNNSPFAGKEGEFVTSRQLRDRLHKELIHNVALRVRDTADPEKFSVSGRGELHLGILIENMRREGYELAVSRPQVIIKEIDGVPHEPVEMCTIDHEEEHQGAIIERMGAKKAELINMQPDGSGRIRLEYVVASSALFGFRNEFLTLTSGSGILHHAFHAYQPMNAGEREKSRNKGVLIANGPGQATAYALWGLQDRGKIMIPPQTEVYEGMIIGLHTRPNDLVVNCIRGKKLTNIRASGSDESIILTPPMVLSLEQAMTFINEDELVEITPKNIRLRKKYLKEHERKRDQKQI